MFFVYRFLDKSNSVIYVGKSKQELQSRFMRHTHLPNECYSMVRKIEYIECPTEADMSIKEIYYINLYRNNPINFNVLDVTTLPTTIEFNDKWKTYKHSLPEHFCNSINVEKGYSKDKEVKFNKDGTISKRKTNKGKGSESFVEGLTREEVDLMVASLIDKINNAENNNQEQIRFRNLLMFVLGVNLPIKTSNFLELKYSDLFDEHDNIKPYSLVLGRFQKDEVIDIPLKKVVKNVLLAYAKYSGINYANNANDSLFQSRKHQIITPIAWGHILKTTASEVGISKNIGAETVRKTYGLNIFSTSEDKLNALLFLGKLWGQSRESQVISYLNLTNDDIDMDYYLGETFSLCTIELSELHCVQKEEVESGNAPNPMVEEHKKTEEKKIEAFNEDSTTKRTYRRWSKDKKLEIVKKYYSQDISVKELAKEYDLDAGNLSRWISAYCKLGVAAFDEKTSGDNQIINADKVEIMLPLHRKTKKNKKETTKKTQVWTAEKKLEIVNKYINQNVTMDDLAKEYGVAKTSISQWLNAYRKFGEKAFADMKKRN